jgi:precorrin-6B methylase 2
MQADEWPGFLNKITRIERAWMGTGNHGTQDHLPWMPYSVSKFVAFLLDAMMVTPGDQFLDIGAGPGTKVMLAEALFSLQAYGIERVRDYVDAAVAQGVQVAHADALSYPAYSEPDILYLNRPCHGQLEVKLERKIMEEMRPGAVLIMANASTRPPDDWEPVTLEWDMNSGVWKKPT